MTVVCSAPNMEFVPPLLRLMECLRRGNRKKKSKSWAAGRVCKSLSSRHNAVIEIVNSQELKLPALGMCKTWQAVTSPSWMGEGHLELYPSLGNYWQWMLGELLSLLMYLLGNLPGSRKSLHTHGHVNNLGETQ